jgi:hypothetical protein
MSVLCIKCVHTFDSVLVVVIVVVVRREAWGAYNVDFGWTAYEESDVWRHSIKVSVRRNGV